MSKPKVLVWLSGGVDSAVSAFLLMQQGYEVIAWFMKNYADESNPHCQTRQDRDSALQVAQHLGIKTFIIFDFRKQYRDTIVDYIIRGYESGITPNPDILCNSEIKFKLFLDHALDLGCHYIATGHYAQIDHTDTWYHLLRWTDHHKDQSYFLSGLDQMQLSHALFPLWHLHKTEVRQIAHDIALPNADRPDSQWLCFIGPVPMRQFLKQYLPSKPGVIRHIDGHVVGTHDGAYQYTIWQRHGLGLNIQSYVVSVDVVSNEVVVWPTDTQALWVEQCLIWDIHWIADTYSFPLLTTAKIRYRQDPIPVRIIAQGTQYVCYFNQAQKGVAPGQTIVLYHGEECIGSALIQKEMSS